MATARRQLGDAGWLDYNLDTVRVGDRLLPTNMRATFPPGSGYPGLEMDLEVVEGVPQCRALRIKARPGDREIRVTDLREIPIVDWVEHFYGLTSMVITSEDETGIHAELRVDEATVRTTARVVQQARSAGRRKITDEFLEEVASIYRAHIDLRPVEAVQQAMAVKYRTAAMYVERARAAKKLPETTPGKRKA